MAETTSSASGTVGVLPDIAPRERYRAHEAAAYWGVPEWFVRMVCRMALVPHVAHVPAFPTFSPRDLKRVCGDILQDLFVASEAFGKRSGALKILLTPGKRPSPCGTIYFADDGHAIKIGYALFDVAERMKSLQTGNSRPIVVVATTPGDVFLERRLHKLFKRVHLRGEWFRKTRTLRRFIGSLEQYNKAITALRAHTRKNAP